MRAKYASPAQRGGMTGCVTVSPVTLAEMRQAQRIIRRKPGQSRVPNVPAIPVRDE
ncbi:hypothetical protein GDI0383 [Gluconacetobacter diazotrophicus PA1 5]|uniref:Uncharacterized protein n=1 Tax=Gluconacetobacter diazotrophicus (strain ATCC 49037 / DSM 5601 / CCUG 37298 / CIP 103539 / LMG 7603 / PAl5) TaxID=272568 RepID=A9H5F5_GLUDA|nr:hypothetical protein GDI0383 [Gluconacetobacter diazotrophicus PA1 5]